MFKNNFDLLKKQKSSKGSSNLRSAFGNRSRQNITETRSLNGAKKYSSSADELVDQLNSSAEWIKPRAFDAIANDCEKLVAERGVEDALRFTLFLRIISRNTQIQNEKVQANGQGLRHETVYRLLWFAVNYPELFKNNLGVFVAVGTWKDAFTMLRADIMSHGKNNLVLDWDFMGDFILTGLKNESQVNLVKKFLPRTKSAPTTNHKAANLFIEKFLRTKLDISAKEYRKLKASGTAHTWQQVIGSGNISEIDFSAIHGRALSLLVRGKFLKNQSLQTKYDAWVNSLGKDETIKFTGFGYEILQNSGSLGKTTADKQFMHLVNERKAKLNSPFVVVVDSSKSMDNWAKVSAWTLARSIAIEMSYYHENVFSDFYLEFSRTTRTVKWESNSPSERFIQMNKSRLVENTNFQSVADLFVKLKKEGLDETEFPRGIVCISDGEFDSTYKRNSITTNVEAFMDKLRKNFSDDFCNDFKIVLWDIPHSSSNKAKFEESAWGTNTIHITGLDASIVKFITSGVKSSMDAAQEAINQPIMDYLKF